VVEKDDGCFGAPKSRLDDRVNPAAKKNRWDFEDVLPAIVRTKSERRVWGAAQKTSLKIAAFLFAFFAGQLGPGRHPAARNPAPGGA